MKAKQIVASIGIIAAAACTNPTSIILEPLRVINWSPGSGSFCIETDLTLYVTFSDDVQSETLTTESLYLRDVEAVVPTTLTYDEVNYTARLVPGDLLAYDTLYTVVATTDIRSAEAGRLPVELAATFRTVPRLGCTSGLECTHPNDCVGRCPGYDSCDCFGTGTCMPECDDDIDCYHGTCTAGGACIPDAEQDGGGGDPGPGDSDGAGD